jgi:hypothetical protein
MPEPRQAQESPTPAPDFSPRKNLKYYAINAFLIFHLIAIPCWCLPFDNPLVGAVRAVVRPYFLWSGLFQTWDMFSPVPETTNSYMEAIIIYKDGQTQTWSFPRMELLTLTDRYSKERYRKFVEVVLDDKNSALWPDVARYVARLPGIREKSPQNILLLVRWSTMVPQPDGTITRTPLDEHVFYRYKVTPEDLQ